MTESRRPDAQSLRLFVALELEAGVREALAATTEALKESGSDRGLRWVRPEGIHITLKFLGSTDEKDLPSVITAVSDAAHPHLPFDLALQDLGSFGGPRSLRVIWVGIGGDTGALASLAGDVDAALARVGFTEESRPYKAHLTLARVREDVSPGERQHLHKLLQEQAPPERAVLHVKHCALMQSALRPGGAVYTRLASFQLAGE